MLALMIGAVFCGIVVALVIIPIVYIWQGDPVKVEVINKWANKMTCRVRYERGKPRIVTVRLGSAGHRSLEKCKDWTEDFYL